MDRGQTGAPLSHDPRDGRAVDTRHSPAPAADAPLVVVVHGSGRRDGVYAPRARHHSEQGTVPAHLPERRGRGLAPVRRRDVDGIGRSGDGVADLFATFLVSRVKLAPHDVTLAIAAGIALARVWLPG